MSYADYKRAQTAKSEAETFYESDEERVSSKNKSGGNKRTSQPSKVIEEYYESDEEITRSKTKPAASKRPPSKVKEAVCESDEEKISAKKSKPTKRATKPKSTTASTSKAPVDPSSWLFGSDHEDDLPRKSCTTSVLSRRVPGGTVRRTAQLDGNLLVELRLYNADEVKDLEGYDRCEKAIVWVRLQGDSDTPEFSTIKKFINLAKGKFTDEGTFFVEKKKK